MQPEQRCSHASLTPHGGRHTPPDDGQRPVARRRVEPRWKLRRGRCCQAQEQQTRQRRGHCHCHQCTSVCKQALILLRWKLYALACITMTAYTRLYSWQISSDCAARDSPFGVTWHRVLFILVGDGYSTVGMVFLVQRNNEQWEIYWLASRLGLWWRHHKLGIIVAHQIVSYFC